MKLIAIFLGLVITMNACSQEKKILASSGQKAWNYAEAYRSGNLLFLSGVPAAGPMDTAISSVYARIELTLKKYGLDFSHVVKETLYTTDIAEVAKHKDRRARFYGEHTPAATWVQVVRLLEPSAVLEVEIIAEIRKTP